MLFQRGERAVYTGEELETIGMPVGGIACGQLYLRGDGTLGLWQIFNKQIFSGYGRDNYRTYRPDSPVDSGFAVVLESGDKTVVRPLNKDFGRVEFAGEYPIGLVRYKADDFPIEVEMEAFSPFIPAQREGLRPARDDLSRHGEEHVGRGSTRRRPGLAGERGVLRLRQSRTRGPTQPDRERQRPHVDRPHGRGDARKNRSQRPGPRSSWRISRATTTATGRPPAKPSAKAPPTGRCPASRRSAAFSAKAW